MAQLPTRSIITCAITGSIHTPTMSDALPITPDEIATQAIDAAKAGAAILHLHARDPKDGRPSPDPEVFRQFLPRIKQSCDAVINITTGGSVTMTVEERHRRRDRVLAGDVLAQHGLDELRALSDGGALQDLEVRLGGAITCCPPTHNIFRNTFATSSASTGCSATATA